MEAARQFAEQYAGLLFALSIGSVITVVLFLTVGARLLARLPADYFLDDERRAGRMYLRRVPTLLRPVVHTLKNAIGLILLIIGIILLVLPGQGLLTMLAGLILMDFPGKFACERWIVRRRRVRDSIDWLRGRAGQPPLQLD